MKPAQLNRLRTFLAGSRRPIRDSRFAIHDFRRKGGVVLSAFVVAATLGASLLAWRGQAHKSEIQAGNQTATSQAPAAKGMKSRLSGSSVFEPLLSPDKTPPKTSAVSFTPGNLVVYRAGDGSTLLSAAASAAFLDEYTPTGTYVQTIALPTAVAGSGNRALTVVGSATSEGQITRSTDGQYISVVGYNAAPATAGLAATTNNGGGGDVNRVIGRVSTSGSVDSTTALIGTGAAPIYTAGNIRDSVIVGSSVYSAGSNAPFIGYTPSIGSSTAVTVTGSGNSRVVNVFGGDIYYSTSTTFNKLAGLPTSTATIIQLLGATAGNAPTNATGFYCLDVGSTGSINTCYLVDGASLKKYSISGTTLTPRGTATVTGSGSSFSGVTAFVSGTSVTLYISSVAKIETITDATGSTGTLSGTATNITLTGNPVTLGANAAFRGMAFAPEILSVTATSPADAATGVATNSTISVTFNIAVNTSTITTQPTTGSCSGSLQVSSDGFSNCIGLGAPAASGGNTIFTATPSAALANSTTYKIRVTTAAKTATGSPLSAVFTQANGFTTAAPDATFTSGSSNLPAGTYNNVTITGSCPSTPTYVTLTGNVIINGTFTINGCGQLYTNNFTVSGPGSFVLNADGWLHITDANGITNAPTAAGNIRTTSRSYSTGANYDYDGSVNQAVGDLPSTVNYLLIANSGTTPNNVVTGNSGQTVSTLLEVIQGVYSGASNYNNVQIDSGGTLVSGAGTMNVSGDWTNDGGTFTPGTGTVNFNNTSGGQQIKGTAATQTFGNLTVTKTSQTLSMGGSTATVVIDGTLTLTSGTLSVGSGKVLTLNGDTTGGGTLDAASGTVNYFGSGTQHVIAANYFLLAFANGSKILPSGTIGIEDTFNPGGTSGHTITGNTIDYRKSTGSQDIAAFDYNNLSNSGGSNRVLPNGGTVRVAGTFSPGGGAYTVTGNTFEYNGTSAQSMPSQGFTYNDLSLFNSAGVSLNAMGSTVTVNGTLFLRSGPFTLANGSADVTMSNGATINRSAGSISATPSVVGTDKYNVSYTGTAALATGPEIPTSASVLNDLTLFQTAGDIDASGGSDITVNGRLYMNQDTDLYMGTLTLLMTSDSLGSTVTNGSGQGEVIGRVRRINFTSGTTYGFGSPWVQFGAFTFATPPTQVDVTMTPERPVDFSQAVKRTYQIDVAGGVGMVTTLRLHYRDGEVLNGNDENTLDLWEGPTWIDQLSTTRSASDNWVERAGIATFSPWTLAPPGPGPTAVKLAKFNAASFADGVQLTWESGFEVNNLGYRLYREQNGKRTRVTPSIVAGSTLLVGQGNRMSAGYSYSWFDPQGTPGTAYYLEAIDLDSSRQTHGPIYPYGGSRNGLSPKRQRALLLNELGKSLANNSGGADSSGWPAAMSAAARSETLKLKPQSLAAQQAIAGGKAVKLQVRQSGWYRVTQPELVAAGFDPSSDARLLQLYVDGEEVPVRLSAEGARLNANDTLEFYGVALDTQTTDTRTYWLVNGTSAGKRISAKRNKIKAGDQNWTDSPGLRSFAFTAERREKLVYSPRLLNGDGENIFGALIFTDPTEQTLAVKNFDRESATPVQLEVALQGLTAQGHEVHVMLNGSDLGSMTFAASAHPTATFAVNRALLHEGDNTVSLTSNNGESDISFVDYVRLTYAHQYRADNNALRFSVPGGGVVRVDGFSTANIRVVDITDPSSPLEVATSGSPSGVGYSVKVQALGNDTRTLMAFADDVAAHPASITANQPSNWNANTNGADLVIITHKDFRQAIEPLATLRRNQGFNVAVVDVEDVYDEFSYGAHTPAAIKSFLMNAATTWARKPGYLLLVGDSSWDPRNFMDQGANDFVPTKLIDTSYMETASDDWLVDFSGQGHAEMALGRLPGRTTAEVSLMVSKIMAYEQERELNVPLRGAVMVADNGFETQSAQTSALLPSSVTKQSFNRAAIGNDDLMRGQLLDALNQGPMIVNFYGHGSVGVWTGAGVLDSDLADTLTNTNRSSIYLMMTCLNGYAHDAYIDSLSESVLKAPNGGAVAVWASSGFTTTEPQFAMDAQFYRLLFGGQPLRLGEAARQAKLATSDLDVRRTWILLGDPTMRVR